MRSLLRSVSRDLVGSHARARCIRIALDQHEQRNTLRANRRPAHTPAATVWRDEHAQEATEARRNCRSKTYQNGAGIPRTVREWDCRSAQLACPPERVASSISGSYLTEQSLRVSPRVRAGMEGQAVSSAIQQATRWPGARSVSAGSSCAQRAPACGQRLRNRHPPPVCAGPDASPTSGIACPLSRGSNEGTAASNARV